MSNMEARLQRLERALPQGEPRIRCVLTFLGDAAYLAEYDAEIKEYVDSVLSNTPRQALPLTFEIRKGEAGGVIIEGGKGTPLHQIPAHPEESDPGGSRESEALESEESA